MAEVARCKVAVLATDGVEQVELTEPMRALRLNPIRARRVKTGVTSGTKTER